MYQLTRVEPTILENAIVDGRIHPAMERKDVARLAAPRHVNSGGDDDQVEALTRQVETAADPVSMKYAQDARDEYLRANDSKANPRVGNENLKSGSIIAEIEKIVQRELHRTGEAASVTVTVFKPSRYSWATGFKTDAFHAVHGISGNPSGDAGYVAVRSSVRFRRASILGIRRAWRLSWAKIALRLIDRLLSRQNFSRCFLH